MPSTFSDYLLSRGVPGLWLRVVNNTTSLAYISTAATDPQGLFTFNPGPPGGIYSVYTGITASGPWIPTGNTSYVIAYTAGDDAALESVSVLGVPPFTPLTGIPLGSMAGASLDFGGLAYNLRHPAYGILTDGSDEASKLNAAYATIPAGSLLYYPAPSVCYGIGARLTPGKANFTHSGVGKFTSTIKRLTNMNDDMFFCDGFAGHVFENLCFDMNDANQSVVGFNAALHFNASSHYNAAFGCRFINSKSFTIYTFFSGTPGPGAQALVERYRDNDITCITGAANDVFIPVSQGGYSIGNKILFGSSAANFNLYESNDHMLLGNTVDLTGGPSCSGAIAVSSVVRCPVIGNTLEGNGNTSVSNAGIHINRETDNGNSREQLGSTCTANDISGFGRAYKIDNFASGIAAVVNTRISGGRVESCNTMIDFHTGTIVGVDITNVDVVNVATVWRLTVTPSFVTIRGCRGINPFGQLNIGAVPSTGVEAVNTFFCDATAYITGGAISSLKVGFQPPPIVVISTAATGGSLAGGATYAYRVSMVDNNGHETLACTEVTIAVPAGTSTNTVTITWYMPGGPLKGATATSYRVYGRTSGAELRMATSQQTNTFLDDGSVTPSGALPGANATLVSVGLVQAATLPYTVQVPCNQSLAVAYTQAPTWTWWGN